MAIIGLGIDLVELNRIERSVDRFGQRFLNKVLTQSELDCLPSLPWKKIEFLAARFAAKEAASKALGTGFRQGISLLTIEVFDLPSGKPELRLSGAAAKRASELGAQRFHVSLTHTRYTAAAVVLLED